MTAISARHTFGSDPDATGSFSARGSVSEGAPGPPSDLSPRPVWWLAARERAAELTDEAQRRIVGRLLSHVEDGWTMAGELTGVFDEQTDGAGDKAEDDELVPRLLEFMKIEVVEVFVGLALAVSTVVPALGHTRSAPRDPVRIDAEGERFARNVLVLHLAASDPVLPFELRDPLRRVCRDLLDWHPDFAVLAAAAARLARRTG